MKRHNDAGRIWEYGDRDSSFVPANMPDLEDVAFEDRVSNDTMGEWCDE
jgi:hypothetical protein